MKFLINFFQDPNGDSSMMRLAVFLVICVPLAIWAAMALKSGHLTNLPGGYTESVMAALGLKCWQNYTEK